MPLSGSSGLASPRCRDPASGHEGPLFIVEDQVAHIRQTAGVADATRLPADVAEEHRRVTLAVVVHEHQLLAELVLEVPQIAPRPPSIIGAADA
jgi:hypothetical protein